MTCSSADSAMAVPDEFSLLCALLSRHRSPADSARLRRKLQSAEIDWHALIHIANSQLLGPAVWYELGRADLHDALEPDAAQYFKGLYELNHERCGRLAGQLHFIVELLNRSGITPVVLKGGAYLTSAFSADPAARMSADLDLLLRPDQLYPAVEHLAGAGYRPLGGIWYMERLSCHYPPLARDGDAAPVELHQHLGQLCSMRFLPEDEIRRRARTVQLGGATVLVLEAADRLLLNIVQSQIQDSFFFRSYIPLRQLYDFVTLSESACGPIDWARLQRTFDTLLGRELFASYTGMAEEFLGWRRPASLRQRSYWHQPLCRLQLRAPRAALPLNALLGTAGVLSRDSIRQRFQCGGSALTIHYHRLRRVCRLASLALRPEQFRRLSRIAGRRSPQVGAPRAGTILRYQLDGDQVCFIPSSESLHVLNRDGAALLEALADGASAESLVAELIERFAVPREKAAQDVRAVQKLLRHRANVSAALPENKLQDKRFIPFPVRYPVDAEYHRSVQYGLLGKIFEVRCPDDLSFRVLDTVIGELRMSSEELPDAVISLCPAEQQHTAVFFKRRAAAVVPTMHQAVPVIVYNMQRFAAHGAQHWLAVHAALASNGQAEVLFPAASGSGKSTLLAHLVSKGWRYISDDIALLHPEGSRPLAVPLPIGIKPGSWEALSQAAPELSLTEPFSYPIGRTLRYCRPPGGLELQPGSGITHIVFPRYRPGASTELRPISRGDALLRLAEAGYQPGGDFDVRFVERLLSWLKTCEPYVLEFETLEAAECCLSPLTGAEALRAAG